MGVPYASRTRPVFPCCSGAAACAPSSAFVAAADAGVAVVAFFHSPLEPETAKVTCSVQELSQTVLFDEQVVFLEDGNTNYWRRLGHMG